MLPFMKNKESRQTGIIVKDRPSDSPEAEDKDDPSAAIEACARALMHAINARDAKAVADCLIDIHEVLNKDPEEEAKENAGPLQNFDFKTQKYGE